MYKAGFVNIIGNPNVGKSTLLNKIIGEKLSIISPKAQTTRQRIMGIVSTDDYQIVFSDTPGILYPKYKLHQVMLTYIEDALIDADVLIYMTDPQDSLKPANEDVLKKIQALQIPIIMIINKIDTSKQSEIEVLMQKWAEVFPNAKVFPISALHNFNIDNLFSTLLELMPEHEPYFDTDNMSDRPMRFFVAEVIREKIFLNYKQEIPYSTHVVVDSFKEFPHITKIAATIYVERETQKPIIIGTKGQAIKHVGIEARKDIEQLLDAKVFLELFVKVDPDWRRNENKLRRLGFEF